MTYLAAASVPPTLPRRRAHLSCAARVIVAVVIALGALAVSSCKRPRDPDLIEPAPSAERKLAPLVVRDDTENLMLTWVDAQGSAHLVYQPADVPFEGRDRVRVVPSDRSDGLDQMFYVANLTTKNPDGAYPITIMTRQEWDKMIEDRRTARIAAAVASVSPPAAAAASGSPDDNAEPGLVVPGLLGGAGTERPTSAGAGSTARGAGAGGSPSTAPRGGKTPTVKFTVIVYGASWCEACHQAMAYLQSRRIPAIEKDIENDPGAAAEMQGKLAKSGLPRGSIPVIDVNGRIMVGFEPHQLDAAVVEASGGTAL